MRCVIVTMIALLVGSCTLAPRATDVVGPVQFSMESGTVRLDARTGQVLLLLPARACVRRREAVHENGDRYVFEEPCQAFPVSGWQSARLVTPWGARLPPIQGGPGSVVFSVPWARTGFDPLADGTAVRLRGPWQVESPDAYPLEWHPGPDDLVAMTALIGAATDTQVEVVDVTAPPQVEVTELHAAEELRNGAEGQLVVTVHNKGSGSAYRLWAVTRSNIPALHGLQVSFGRLDPGESKTRRVAVNLPRTNDETDAVVVLLFHEAHNFAPARASATFAVHPAADAAKLAIDCSFLDATGSPPLVDAGRALSLSCDVRNDGAPVDGVRVSAAVEGRPGRATSATFSLGTGKSRRVLLAVDVPQDAAIDSELDVAVEVASAKGDASARTRLVATVARPQICPDGKLTREEYARKLAELRRKLEAGLITRAEFEKYEAELVACLE